VPLSGRIAGKVTVIAVLSCPLGTGMLFVACSSVGTLGLARSCRAPGFLRGTVFRV
jgi:hypothetical protein